MTIREIHKLPENFINTPPEMLHTLFEGPTVIHIQGKKDPPLFVSTLLHGNEPTGILAVQKLLQEEPEFPRSLSLLVGNVKAAAQKLRMLPEQVDWNRVWEDGDSPECIEAQRFAKQMEDKGLFASVDIHNNTGKNPLYSCIGALNYSHINLASLFSRTMVYFEVPKETLTHRFARFTPATTLECGMPGEPRGVEEAKEFLKACLHLSEIASDRPSPHDVDLYSTMVKMRIPEHLSFAFADERAASSCDIVLREDLETLNFSEIEEGTYLATIRPGARIVLEDENHNPILNRFLGTKGTKIHLTETAYPSMFTRDKSVIRNDCLGYLMLPIGLP